MQTIEEVLNAWSWRFAALGIEKAQLQAALQFKPIDATLDALFKICEKIRTLHPKYEFRTSWELVMLSQDETWVRNQLEVLDDNVITDILTPAHFAAASGNTQCLFIVLDKFPKLTSRNGWTIAHSAAMFSSAIHLFRIFHRIPQLLDSKDFIFRVAIKSNNVDCTLWLAETYIEFPQMILDHLVTPLGKVILQVEDAISRVVPIFEKLLDWKDVRGVPVSHHLALGGRHEILFPLLDAHPDLIRQRSINNSCLAHTAAAGGDLETFSGILARHPEFIDAVDNLGRTVGHYAMIHHHTDVLRHLISHHSNVIEQADQFGWTVLHQAAYQGDATKLEILLLAGQSPTEKKDHLANTAQTYAQMATLCAKISVAKENLALAGEDVSQDDLKLLDTVVDLFEAWQQVDYQQLGRSFRLYDVVAEYLTQLLKHRELMVEEKLVRMLPANTETTRTLYGLYFACTLVDKIGYFQLNAPNPAVIRKALLAAMTFCLNARGQMVIFSEDDQKLFDTYLKSATTGYSLDTISDLLLPQERLDLVHQMIVEELQELEQKNQTQGFAYALTQLLSKTADTFSKVQSYLIGLSSSDDEFAEVLNALQVAKSLFVPIAEPIRDAQKDEDIIFNKFPVFSCEFDYEKVLIKVEIENHAKAFEIFEPEKFYSCGWEHALIGLKKLSPNHKAADRLYRAICRGHSQQTSQLWNHVRNELNKKNKAAVLKILQLLLDNGVEEVERLLNIHYDAAADLEAMRLMTSQSASHAKQHIISLLEQAASSKLGSSYYYLGRLMETQSIEKAYSLYYQGAILGDISCKNQLIDVEKKFIQEYPEQVFWGTLFLGLVDKSDDLLIKAQKLNAGKFRTFACMQKSEEFIEYSMQWKLLNLVAWYCSEDSAVIQAGSKLLKTILTDCGDFNHQAFAPYYSGLGELFTKCALQLAVDEAVPFCNRQQMLYAVDEASSSSQEKSNEVNLMIKQLIHSQQNHTCVEKLPQIHVKTELSRDAQSQIQSLVHMEMHQFRSAQIEKADILAVLIWLTETPTNEEGDNLHRMRMFITMAESSFIYYLLAPKLMHASIQNQNQVAQARLYLLEVIHKQILKLSYELGILKEIPDFVDVIPVCRSSTSLPSISARAPSSEFFQSPMRSSRVEGQNSEDCLFVQLLSRR